MSGPFQPQPMQPRYELLMEHQLIEKRDQFEADLPRIVASIKVAEAEGDKEKAEMHRDTYSWVVGRIEKINKLLGL